MAITKINTPELFDLGATNSSLQLPSGNTASRPTNPSTGEWRYNTDDNKVEYWDGADWFQIEYEAPVPPPPITPTENFQTVTYTGNGATQTVDSKFDMAANFNGSSSKIDLPVLGLSGGTARSVSAWIKTTNNSTTQFIFGSGTQAAYQVFAVHLSPTGKVSVSYSASQLDTTSTPINNNQWHHIAVTFSGGSTANTVLYVDGVSQTLTEIGSAGTVNTGNQNYAIGYNSPNPSFPFYFNGSIDQVRIFNTALNSTQVSELYNDETADTASVLNFPTGAGCVAAYQFNGNPADVGGTYGGVATDIGYTGLEFQPDLVWIKPRSYADNHNLFDSIRGATKQLISNNADAESTQPNTLTSFDSNGFTTGPDNNTNINGSTYVGWCFKGGGAAVSNTDGTITSQVSANQAAGFSIVKYTGNSTAGATVGHGLSEIPQMIIVKRLSLPIDNWAVYNETIGNTYRLALDESGAAAGPRLEWNSTSPTNTVFTLGNHSAVNQTSDYIAYCFHSVAGYSKVGSYTGTGAAGNLIETGFEPAWIMFKNTSSGTNNWVILDNKRSASNPRNLVLSPNTSGSETTETVNVNFLSNGFEQTGGNSDVNDGGATYIYLAIAANPRPAPVLENSFDISLYTGNGTTQNIYSSLSPDLVWVKGRSTADNHFFNDSVRGAGYTLYSNLTSQETLPSADPAISSFDSNGFTLSSSAGVNRNGSTYVGWQWKAAGIPTINTDGTITSTVSANQAAGFSIVKYAGNATSGATYGHGLSATPELVITKVINSANAWWVFTPFLGSNYFMQLNTDAALTTDVDYYYSVSSTVFTLNSTSVALNGSGLNYISYCFHSVAGYQKVGSYTGAVGKTLDFGFSPRFVMIKKTDSAYNWNIYDNQRGGGVLDQRYLLLANTNSSEFTSSVVHIDFTSNGVSFPNSYDGTNQTGGTYIYLAIG